MFRLSSKPVAASTTDTPRARPRRPRVAARRARAVKSAHHPTSLIPSDLELGPLFVHTRDAVVVGNLDTGGIVLWNPAAERIFGWSASEAVGQPLEMLIPPALIRVHQERLALYRRTGQGTLIGCGQPLELPALTKGGEEITIELSLAPFDTPAGDRQYAIALLRDVSERQRAEARSEEAAQAVSDRHAAELAIHQHQQVVEQGLEQLRRELRRLRRSGERLTRSVASLPQLAEKGRPGGSRRLPDMEPGPETAPSQAARLALQARVIERRAERMQRALEVFATRARMKAGELEPHLERVNLVPLLGKIVADTRRQGRPHKVNVAMPQGLTAQVDADLIECAVRALIEHALARSPRGSWVDVELRRPLTGLARLEVRSFGPPLPAAERRRLRELVQIEPSLALSRAILEQHRGSLSLEFPVEGGVSLVASLPTNRVGALVSSGQSPSVAPPTVVA